MWQWDRMGHLRSTRKQSPSRLATLCAGLGTATTTASPAVPRPAHRMGSSVLRITRTAPRARFPTRALFTNSLLHRLAIFLISAVPIAPSAWLALSTLRPLPQRRRRRQRRHLPVHHLPATGLMVLICPAPT